MLTKSGHTCRLGLQDKPCATARVINLLQGAVRAICISRTVQPIRHLQPSFFVIGWWWLFPDSDTLTVSKPPLVLQ